MGAHYTTSVKHLDDCLQEREFRVDSWKCQFMFRDLLTRLLTNEASRYQSLVA